MFLNTGCPVVQYWRGNEKHLQRLVYVSEYVCVIRVSCLICILPVLRIPCFIFVVFLVIVGRCFCCTLVPDALAFYLPTLMNSPFFLFFFFYSCSLVLWDEPGRTLGVLLISMG